MYVGVKNKYCSVCFKSKSTETPEINNHICFKNWDSTSTGMESDIILEGFKQSIPMHNLIYHKLIGDGDSSVTKKIRMAKPYGPDCVVQKIECKNHILRNYMNRINDICVKRKSSIGIIVPGYLRKIVKDNKLRLR